MTFLFVVIGIFVASVWIVVILCKASDRNSITDRDEMRRLSRKLQSSDKYRPCGKD